MKTRLILIIFISLILGGCFAPLNLSYDSAKTLDKGQIELQGAYSRYYAPNDSLSNTLINNNLGFSLGYGITDNYNLKFRYEYINPTVTFQRIFGKVNKTFKVMNSLSYFEINNKLRLAKDNLAISLPLGAYVYNSTGSNEGTGGLGWFSFDPRLYLTFFRSTGVFELTIIPKAHVLFGKLGGYGMFGLSVGMGFSSDLDKWAIRPEIGFDRFLSFGIGANFNFNTVQKTD
jgi:hypothetical protein